MMEIDWGNAGFLRLYGIVFGLSVVLTMGMWLIAVVKRAVRGVPLGQAAMENIGYLLMSVVVAGFMPAAVAYTVDFVDSAAERILGDYVYEVFGGGLAFFVFLVAIMFLMPGFGVVVAIPLLLMLLFSVIGLWVMLVVRNAMILMGLIFGPLVFSGLVDKDLWGHTRKWVGLMGGIIASKLGIYLALALAGAMFDGATDIDDVTLPQAIGGCITFLALLFLALIMPFQVAKWLPFVGDEIQSMHQMKSEAGQRHRSMKASGREADSDLKAQAGKNQPSGPNGVGGGAAGVGGAAGTAAAGMAVKQAADNVRDQVGQAAQGGANNASGDGGSSGTDSGSGKGDSPDGPTGSGGGRGGSSGGRPPGGAGAVRRPTPTPPSRTSGSRPGTRPGGPTPPPPRPGGPASPPPAPSPPPRPSGPASPPPIPSPPPRPSGPASPPPPRPET